MLNREQIVKALEWCSELRLCVDCPMRAEGYFSHSGNACRKALMENALSLIKKLTEENERLNAQVEMWKSTAYCEKDRVDSIKIDTVRKMHFEIKARCIKGGIYPAFVKSTIDQIAKELIEGV